MFTRSQAQAQEQQIEKTVKSKQVFDTIKAYLIGLEKPFCSYKCKVAYTIELYQYLLLAETKTVLLYSSFSKFREVLLQKGHELTQQMLSLMNLNPIHVCLMIISKETFSSKFCEYGTLFVYLQEMEKFLKENSTATSMTENRTAETRTAETRTATLVPRRSARLMNKN
jgi:hypothetical protein